MKRFSAQLAILTLSVMLLATSGCAQPGASQVQEDPGREAEPEQSTAAAPSPPAQEPAAVAQPAPIAAAEQEAPSGPGKIAFASNRDGNLEIYVMNADGSGATRLTNNADTANEPAWSPDGTRIAYVSRVGEGNWEIYVMEVDGSNQVRLTHNLAREAYPAWSPDGAKIAFLSARQGHQEIFLMNADGSNQVSLADLEPTGIFRRHLAPAWSPDGAKIAYNRHEGENHEIFVVDPDGANEIRLTTEGGGWSAWSPDGTQIAFLSRREVSPGIYVMNADGSGTIGLLSDSEMAPGSGLDWAPGTVPLPLVTAQTTASGPGARMEPEPVATVPRLQLVGTALTEDVESPLAGVHVHGNYAFVGSQNIAYPPFEKTKTGIRILDISDPANPLLVGRIPLRSVEKSSGVGDTGCEVPCPHSHGDAVATRIESPAFQGDIAIVLQGVPDTFTEDEYPMPFGIWDVTDPSVPGFLGPLSLGNHFSADSLGDKPDDTKAVHGHYFYAIYSTGRMEHPRDHEGDRDHHLAIVDLSDPRSPVVVGHWQDTKQVSLRGLSINPSGTRVYIIGQFEKELLLYVLDVQDPADPVELGRFVWPLPFAGSFSPGRPVANADDSLVIFADGSWERGRQSRLHIIDISDLSAIHELSSVGFPPDRSTRTSYWAHDLAVKGDLVYSTWLRGGVQAIDISDPTNPVKVAGFFSPNKEARDLSDVALFGDYVVATAVWGPGLYILGPPGPDEPQSTVTAPSGQGPPSAPVALMGATAPAGLKAIVGRWEGALKMPRREMEFAIEFWADDDGLHGSRTSPLRDESLPLVDIRFEPPVIHFADAEGQMVFDGELEGDTIAGQAGLQGRSAPFSLKRTAGGQ